MSRRASYSAFHVQEKNPDYPNNFINNVKKIQIIVLMRCLSNGKTKISEWRERVSSRITSSRHFAGSMRKKNSLLNVTYREKSFKLHKIRHDQKLAISISFCLKNLNFQGEISKFRVKASVNQEFTWSFFDMHLTLPIFLRKSEIFHS